MATCPDMPVVFGFDYKMSDIPALQHPIGLKLWALIKAGHITDQYFNDQVYTVAKKIEKTCPQNFNDFMEILQGSELLIYGRKAVRNWTFDSLTELDLDFWFKVWSFIGCRFEFRAVIKINEKGEETNV